MKKLKDVIAISLVFAMAFSLIGCGKAREKADEDDETEVDEEASVDGMKDLIRDFPGIASERLGISESYINEYDPSEMNNEHAFEGVYYICNGNDMPRIECAVYDDPDEAREVFEEYYTTFNEQFREENFHGEYLCFYEDNRGYIVINGSDSGTHIFGDLYASGSEVYAGVYYEDNAVILIMPRNDVDNSTVEDVISDLGLPMANGDNT